MKQSAESDALLHTPEEWCLLLDASVMDPDGWRDGTRGWDEPITRDEFDRRLIRCTIDARRYPTFWKPSTSPVGKPDCDTCGETGLIDWMIEGDPNCYQEPDSDGKIPCPDCSARVTSPGTTEGGGLDA